MAYSTPPTKATGDTLTAAEWNTNVRDNMAASAPDVFTTKGDLFVATGADVGAVLAAGSNYQIPEALSTEATGIRWTSLAPCARMQRASLSITNNSETKVTSFASPDIDNGGLISADTFVIPRTGLYLITAEGLWTGHATAGTLRRIGVVISSYGSYFNSVCQDVNSSNMFMAYSGLHYLVAGISPVVEMRVYQQSGVSLAIGSIIFAISQLR